MKTYLDMFVLSLDGLNFTQYVIRHIRHGEKPVRKTPSVFVPVALFDLKIYHHLQVPNTLEVPFSYMCGCSKIYIPSIEARNALLT